MKDWGRKLDIVGLILLVAAFLLYRIGASWTLWTTLLTVIGAAAIVAAIVARRGEIRQALGRRSTRFGANSVTSVILLAGVLGLVNYLGVRHEARWDLTSEKLFTLAPQSQEVLDQLDGDVHMLAFYPDNDPGVENLLNLYKAQSPKVSFEFIDPDVEPQRASQYDVTVYGVSGFSSGTLILEMGDRRERVESETAPLSEQDVTNALIKLAKGETKTIYFVEGHGEKEVSDTERGGLDTARQALERENYRVEELNLVDASGVPEDAAVLVWAGPHVEPFEEEIDLVDAWLNGGGSLLLMLDPPPDGASMASLTDRWSVSLGDDFVVDASGIGQLLLGAGPEVPVVSDYAPTHPITKGFGLMTLFPLVRSVTSTAEPGGDLTVTPLASTSPRSWGESQLEGGEVSFDAGVDTEGPVNIGVAIERHIDEDKTARLVVIGDSDFASNSFFGIQGNGDLFVNAVSWLAEDEGFIAIRPKEPDDRPLTLTETQTRVSYYVSMYLFPLSVLVAGISVWVRRRKL